MKKITLLLLWLFSCFTVYAQAVAVQGTIVDSDSTIWFNAHVTVTWVPNSSYPNANQYTYQGQPLTNSTALLRQTVTADGSGIFNVTVIDSNQIQPAGSTYQFVIQSYTSAQSSVLPNIALTGSSQDVSSFIHTNITAPRFAATSGQYGGAYGYGTNEVSVTPVPGGSFFNVTSGVIDVWACSAAGCSWQTQAVGSFCSSISCSFTTSVFSPNINNVCEASQQAGATDFVDAFNKCAAQSYMATGGIITAYGYGNSTQIATTVLIAGTNSAQPIGFLLGSATTFIFNEVLGTTASPSNCIWPQANGSTLTGVGFVAFSAVTNFQLGPAARTYDFFCNAIQDGTQETVKVDGITLDGNPSAVMTGSLMHLKNIFTPSRISNVATYHPYGNSLTVDSGSDIEFDNDSFNDSATSGNYPGAVVTLNCPVKVTFNSGSIQNNGIHNPLLVINSDGSAPGGCNPSGGGGYQAQGVRFYNVDYETIPATIGSFSGHATNVDPIQVWDPSDVVFDGMTVFGAKNSAQVHLIDVMSSHTGFIQGPFEVSNVTALAPPWTTGISLIHNTIPQVAPTLQDVYGTAISGTNIGIGFYRWTGSLHSGDNSTDYYDNVNIANLNATYSGIVPTPFASINGFCITGYEGHIASITDSSTNAWGATITGGGTNHVFGYCDGTKWTVAGASNNSGFSQAITICASGCTNTISNCTTTGLAWASGACNLGTYTWPVNFTDNQYAPTCQIMQAGGIGGGAAAFVYITSQAVSGVSLALESATTATVTINAGSQINCSGVHN